MGDPVSGTSPSILANTTLLPIAQLTPSLSSTSQYSIKAVVALIWPYSSSNRSFALLLVEPDFRLRRLKGQVRVSFSGSAAKAVARSGIGSGDEVILALKGVTWGDDKVTVDTPGKGVDCELQFRERVNIQVNRESQLLTVLDIDHSSPSPDPQIQSITPRRSATPIVLTGSQDGPRVSAASNVWDSPAFFNRTRTVSGSLFVSSYDPFAGEDDDGFIEGRGRKRTKFAREGSSWTFADRTLSPEKELDGASSKAIDLDSDSTQALSTADFDNVLGFPHIEGSDAPANRIENTNSSPQPEHSLDDLEPPTQGSGYDDNGMAAELPIKVSETPISGEASQSYVNLALQQDGLEENVQGITKPDSQASPVGAFTLPNADQSRAIPDSSSNPLRLRDLAISPSGSAPTPPLLQVKTNLDNSGGHLATSGSDTNDIPDQPHLRPIDSALMPQVSPLGDEGGNAVKYASADYVDQYERSFLQPQTQATEPESNQGAEQGGSSSTGFSVGAPSVLPSEHLNFPTGEINSSPDRDGSKRARSIESEIIASHNVQIDNNSERPSSTAVIDTSETLQFQPTMTSQEDSLGDADEEESEVNDFISQLAAEGSDEVLEETWAPLDQESAATTDDTGSEYLSGNPAVKESENDYEDSGGDVVNDESSTNGHDVEEVHGADDADASSNEDDTDEDIDEEDDEVEIDRTVSIDDKFEFTEDAETNAFELESTNQDAQAKNFPNRNVIDLTGENLSDETDPVEELNDSQLDAEDVLPGIRGRSQLGGSDDSDDASQGLDVKFEEISEGSAEPDVPGRVDAEWVRVASQDHDSNTASVEAKYNETSTYASREIADSYDDEDDDFSVSDSNQEPSNGHGPVRDGLIGSTKFTSEVLENELPTNSVMPQRLANSLNAGGDDSELLPAQAEEELVVVVDLEDVPDPLPQADLNNDGPEEDDLHESHLKFRYLQEGVSDIAEQGEASISPMISEDQVLKPSSGQNAGSIVRDITYPSSPPEDVEENLPSSPPSMKIEDQSESLHEDTVNTQLVTPQATQQQSEVSRSSEFVNAAGSVAHMISHQHLTPEKPQPNPTPFTPGSHRFIQDKLEEAKRALPKDKPSALTPTSHRFVHQRLEEARRSLARTRLEHPGSDVPEVLSPWFAPRKSVQSTREDDDDDDDDEEEEEKEEEEKEEKEKEEEEEEEEEASTAALSPDNSEPDTNHIGNLELRELLSSPSSNHDIPVNYTRKDLSFSSLPASDPSLPPTGLRTPLSYYAPLSTLSTFYNTHVSILSICYSSTPITRANSGPRDYNITLYITDPSSAPNNTTVQIFRPFKEALPLVEPGDAVLLRNFKVASFKRRMSLISQASSAWAVFKGREAHVTGPPVELGAEERGFTKGLREWWRSLGEEMKSKMQVTTTGDAKKGKRTVGEHGNRGPDRRGES